MGPGGTPWVPASWWIGSVCAVDVCEVFSPPSVGREARKYGLEPGEAMDLTTGWDFNLKSHQGRAEKFIGDHNPLVVIGSPPCTPFSQLQAFSPDRQKKKERWAEGVMHMELVVNPNRKHVGAGRVFIHENLAHATSWALPTMRTMMEELGVM